MTHASNLSQAVLGPSRGRRTKPLTLDETTFVASIKPHGRPIVATSAVVGERARAALEQHLRALLGSDPVICTFDMPVEAFALVHGVCAELGFQVVSVVPSLSAEAPPGEVSYLIAAEPGRSEVPQLVRRIADQFLVVGGDAGWALKASGMTGKPLTVVRGLGGYANSVTSAELEPYGQVRDVTIGADGGVVLVDEARPASPPLKLAELEVPITELQRTGPIEEYRPTIPAGVQMFVNTDEDLLLITGPGLHAWGRLSEGRCFSISSGTFNYHDIEGGRLLQIDHLGRPDFRIELHDAGTALFIDSQTGGRSALERLSDSRAAEVFSNLTFEPNAQAFDLIAPIPPSNLWPEGAMVYIERRSYGSNGSNLLGHGQQRFRGADQLDLYLEVSGRVTHLFRGMVPPGSMPRMETALGTFEPGDRYLGGGFFFHQPGGLAIPLVPVEDQALASLVTPPLERWRRPELPNLNDATRERFRATTISSHDLDMICRVPYQPSSMALYAHQAQPFEPDAQDRVSDPEDSRRLRAGDRVDLAFRSTTHGFLSFRSFVLNRQGLFLHKGEWGPPAQGRADGLSDLTEYRSRIPTPESPCWWQQITADPNVGRAIFNRIHSLERGNMADLRKIFEEIAGK